jgi:hypothetical protein
MPEEIEAWARQVIASTESGAHFEDGLVELKSDWPASDFEAARQLAAQANAVAGNPILWLIGVKQGKGVVGISPRDLAQWWPQVRRHFDKSAPRLLADRILEYSGARAVALMFDPSEPPYVIVYPPGDSAGKKAISREVPWREGTAMRSADREDLLRILAPVGLVPEIRIITGLMNILQAQEKVAGAATPNKLTWYLRTRIFVQPRSTQPVVFTASEPPLAKVHLLERDIVLRPFPSGLDAAGGLVEMAGTEVVFRGAASLDMMSVGGETEVFSRQPDELTMTFSWKPVGAPRAAHSEIQLRRATPLPNIWDRWDIVLEPEQTP